VGGRDGRSDGILALGPAQNSPLLAPKTREKWGTHEFHLFDRLLGGGFFLGSLAQCGHGGGGVIFAVFVFGAAFSFGGVVILRHRTSWFIGGWGRRPGFVFEEVAVSSRFTWAVYPDGTKCGAGFGPTPGLSIRKPPVRTAFLFCNCNQRECQSVAVKLGVHFERPPGVPSPRV